MERVGQSRMGVVSLALAVASALVSFLIVLIAGVWEVSAPGGVDENSAAAVLLGLTLFGSLGVNLVSLGLGIAGIVQKSRNRVFAFIGTAIAAASFVITVSIIVAGMFVDA